jgi:hypothetical protein
VRQQSDLWCRWGRSEKPLLNVFTKIMIANIYVLGPWVYLWKPCKFQGSGVVFKYLAVDLRFDTNDLEFLLPHFLKQVHDGNDLTQCL